MHTQSGEIAALLGLPHPSVSTKSPAPDLLDMNRPAFAEEIHSSMEDLPRRLDRKNLSIRLWIVHDDMKFWISPETTEVGLPTQSGMRHSEKPNSMAASVQTACGGMG